MFHVTDRPQKLLNKRALRLCDPDRSLLKIAGLCFVFHLRVVVWYFAWDLGFTASAVFWDLELIAFGSWNLLPQAALPCHQRCKSASPFLRERIEVRVATKAVPPKRTRLPSRRCRVRSELDGSKTEARWLHDQQAPSTAFDPGFDATHNYARHHLVL
jgi:hypothetical protein